MAFTDAQKTKIRLFLGFSSLSLDLTTFLESAMSQVEGTEVETLIIALITDIASIDTKIENLYCDAATISVGAGKSKAEYDVYRGVLLLRKLGRDKINQISIMLNTNPVRDYYTSAEIDTGQIGVHYSRYK